jgi:hypothetical protein
VDHVLCMSWRPAAHVITCCSCASRGQQHMERASERNWTSGLRTSRQHMSDNSIQQPA